MGTDPQSGLPAASNEHAGNFHCYRQFGLGVVADDDGRQCGHLADGPRGAGEDPHFWPGPKRK